MGHPITLSPAAFHAPRRQATPVQNEAPIPTYGSPEDDRALARMLGVSLLLGLGVTGGAIWGVCSAAVAAAG